MKPTARWRLTLGLVVVAGFAGTGQIAVAGSSPTKLSFAIHVRNYAGVDSKTLAAAEKVASRYFPKSWSGQQLGRCTSGIGRFVQCVSRSATFGLSSNLCRPFTTRNVRPDEHFGWRHRLGARRGSRPAAGIRVLRARGGSGSKRDSERARYFRILPRNHGPACDRGADIGRGDCPRDRSHSS